MAKALRLFAVVLVSLLFVFWRTSAILQPGSRAAALALSEGDQICPELLGNRNNGHDMFVVSTDSLCPVCELVKPFESKLTEFGESIGIRTIYLLTDGLAGEPLAERYQADGKSVVRARASALGLNMTPTFLRISSTGVVKAIWMGGFRDESSRQLAWDSLTQEIGRGLRNITSADLSATAGQGPVIVGFSKSVFAVFPGAKYFDEKRFGRRELDELDKRRGVILDCRSGSSLIGCQHIGRALVQIGFPDVKMIGIPSGRPVCSSRIPLSGNRRPSEVLLENQQ